MASRSVAAADSTSLESAPNRLREVTGSQHPGVSIFFAILACAATAYLLWTTNRGFDIWDEGFYLLMSRHPEDIGAYPGSYYYYTHLLFMLSGMDIPTFRALGILCVFATTTVLACGLRGIDTVFPAARFHARDALGFVGLTAFLFLGTLVYYGSMARTTPSYNLITSMCLTAGTGTTLLGLAALSKRDARAACIWLFITGVLVAVEFMTKAPSAILMAAAVSALIWLWPQTAPTVLARYRVFGAFVSGGLIWLGLHFAIFETPRAYLAKVQAGLAYQRDAGVKIDLQFLWDTVVANGRLAGSILKQSWSAVIVFAVLFWSYTRLRGTGSRALVPLCWIAVAGVVAAHIAARYYMGGHTGNNVAWRQAGFYAFWVGAMLGFLACLYVQNYPTKEVAPAARRQALLLMLLLAAIPFFGAFGTTGPHQIILAYNCVMATWFALLVYVGSRVEAYGLPLRIPAQLAVAGFAVAQLVSGYLAAPYGNPKGVLQLDAPTTLGSPPSTMLLDRDTHEALEALKSAAAHCNFKAGDRMLGFYGVPGLVYALGGRPVMLPAFTGNFWGPPEVTASAAEAALKRLPREQARDAFVILFLRNYVDAPELRAPDLQAIGRRMPSDYELCGSTIWPRAQHSVELWKPIVP
jgi:hypothetical protein